MIKKIILSLAMILTILTTLTSYKTILKPSVPVREESYEPYQNWWNRTGESIARNAKHAWNRTSYALGYQDKEKYLRNKTRIQLDHSVTKEDIKLATQYQKELSSYQIENAALGKVETDTNYDADDYPVDDVV